MENLIHTVTRGGEKNGGNAVMMEVVGEHREGGEGRGEDNGCSGACEVR